MSAPKFALYSRRVPGVPGSSGDTRSSGDTILNSRPSSSGEGLGWGFALRVSPCGRRGPTPLRLGSRAAKSHCPSPEGDGAIWLNSLVSLTSRSFQNQTDQATSASSSRPPISTSGPVSIRIIASVCAGPGVNRRRSVLLGTVGWLIGWT